MALAAGAQLGPYIVQAPLGAGGMGEVYRARDSKLGRDVALKILPDTFAADPNRLARFRREAQVLASLNHPNIGAIYGFEEASSNGGPAKAGHSVHALVLELVEGPTLADRIARGPVPVEDALRIATQIADALEAAHEKGIVHRDLKPANVKITPDGKVKVLDFGLAKAMTDDESGVRQPAVTHSPTLSVMATQAGLILGTAAHMSPEQAEGKPVDHRSDIFSFGSVLYEMLTGRQAFVGDTAAAILASVLIREPDLTALPPNLNTRLEELLRRCFAKNPKQRWQAVGDVRAEIDAIATHPYRVSADPRPSWRTYTLPIAVAVVVTAVVTSAVWWQRAPVTSRAMVVRFPMTADSGLSFITNTTTQILTISPDGGQIVYAAGGRLYRRVLAELEPRPIPGTESSQGLSSLPIFSPDGGSVAFLSLALTPIAVSVKKVDLATSAVVTLASIGFPYGLSWDPAGILVGQGDKGILRLSPDGGSLKQLITVKDGQLAQGPQMLPDGDHVLFTLAANSGNAVNWDAGQIVVQSVTSGQRTVLIRGGSEAHYVPSGHIVYAIGGALYAVLFDPERLQVLGERRQVLDGVRRSSDDLGPIIGTAVQFAVSANGTLAYLPGPSSSSAARSRGFALSDRKGTVESLSLPPGLYESPRVSPDGKHVAFDSDDGKEATVWVYDLDGKSQRRRITFDGRSRLPVWSPDGTRLAFQSDRDGDRAIWSQPADGSGKAARLTKADRDSTHVPESWSPDGRSLLLGDTRNSRTTLKILSLPAGTLAPFGGVESDDAINSVFSPDGRWVAYTIREKGSASHSIYVQPFPPTGATYQISKGEDAHHPIWSRDGHELSYIPGPLRLASVGVSMQPTFTVGNPSPLPRNGITLGTGPSNVRNHDITPDGARFIGVVPSAEGGARNEMQASSTGRRN